MATEVSKRQKREVASATSEGLVDVENAYFPDTDIYDTQEALVLLMDIPGVKKGDVKLELDETNTLQVRAKSSFEEPKGAELREFQCGDYFRAFQLSDQYSQDNISAKLENGLLEITIPKKEEAKPKRISISA